MNQSVWTAFHLWSMLMLLFVAINANASRFRLSITVNEQRSINTLYGRRKKSRIKSKWGSATILRTHFNRISFSLQWVRLQWVLFSWAVQCVRTSMKKTVFFQFLFILSIPSFSKSIDWWKCMEMESLKIWKMAVSLFPHCKQTQ